MSFIYSETSEEHDALACGETDMLQEVNAYNFILIMGDKSPKSNQKKSNQKQTKASNTAQIKQKAIADKQSANKK